VAWYDASHLRRLEAITALQKQGFNLVAIAAILGVRGPDLASEAVTSLLRRVAQTQPTLLHALSRHGVVARGEDGDVRTVRPRAVRAALELNRSGVPAVSSLEVLAQALDAVHGIAADLVNTTSARVLALAPDVGRGGTATWDEYDRNSVALTQSLASLLTEAFRVAVENIGRTAVADQIARRIDIDLGLVGSAVVDAG
jgi:hypothetical protein